VRSRRNAAFRKRYAALPKSVQDQAIRTFRLWRSDPAHPSLHFKKVHPRLPIYSARVTQGYRALCVRDREVFIWFWIGPHAEYDRLLNNL
jgi:hypothetical protein